MKVLTLHQPWASLVALGVKTIETRSWSTQYRGPLAIHAARKVLPYDDRQVKGWGVEQQLLAEGGGLWLVGPGRKRGWTLLPLGAIVATCTLVDVVPIIANGSDEHRDAGFQSYVLASTYRPLRLCDWARIGWGDGVESYGARHVDVQDQRPCGDFSSGRYAWLLADIVPVDPPVPFKGGQGLTRTWEPAATTIEQ